MMMNTTLEHLLVEREVHWRSDKRQARLLKATHLKHPQARIEHIDACWVLPGSQCGDEPGAGQSDRERPQPPVSE